MTVLKTTQDLAHEFARGGVDPGFNSGAKLQLIAKRSIDIAISAALIFVLSPLLVAVGLAIKLTSRGRILFRQPRYGLDNELFDVLKFRSMYIDRGDRTGVAQTQAKDPRVTPIGKFIRRTNIDELPQLVNVLRGDMSLVGPRPHVPGMRAAGVHYEALVPRYFARHRVRPGITGLAQVNRLRGSTAHAKFAKARIDYDIAYIENWSLFLDMRILWLTLKTEVARGTGS